MIFPLNPCSFTFLYLQGLLSINDGDTFGNGRVNILNDIDGANMAICADDNWNEVEVDIVCKQIGFEGSAETGNIFISKWFYESLSEE